MRTRPLPVLLIATFLLAWFPRMFWGFWTDEAGTFWMAAEGWRAAIDRTSAWAGQSVLYSMLESFFAVKGSGQEFLLRVPSVLAMVWAGWEMKRTAELAIGKNVGWLATIPLVCAPEAIEFGTSARPYALALAASLASFRYLLEWQQLVAAGAPRRWMIAKYLGASILTLYLHYLFAFAIAIQAAYLAFCWIRRSGALSLDLPVAAAVALPLSLVPLLRALLVTAQTTSDFANASKPQFEELFRLCFPPAILLGAALGAMLLIASARKLKWRPAPVRPEVAFLVLAWLLAAPVLFFFVARLTPHSVFNSRYLLFTLPAFSLLLMWFVNGLDQQPWRMTVAVAMFGASVMHPGMLLYSFREGPMSWRPPLVEIAKASPAGKAAPVFVESGMANSGGLNWQEHDPATSPLYAALLAYPLANRSIPLPYQFSQQAQDFIERKIQSDLASEPRFWLVAASGSPQAAWMIDHLRKQGFESLSTAFNDFVVVDFRRVSNRGSLNRAGGGLQ
jgi:hypothetical protein